jgi:two-component system cell cycle sensor histidine kinase/response regulator CckA
MDLAKEILGFLGYQVTATTDSSEALKFFSSSPDRFDLLITDVTMPGMTGDVLVEHIHLLRPDFPVLICTGFCERLSQGRLKALKTS